MNRAQLWLEHQMERLDWFLYHPITLVVVITAALAGMVLLSKAIW